MLNLLLVFVLVITVHTDLISEQVGCVPEFFDLLIAFRNISFYFSSNGTIGFH